MQEIVIQVEGYEITLEQFGLATRLIGSGQVVRFLTQKGRHGVAMAFGDALHCEWHDQVLSRCMHLPISWAFQLKAVAMRVSNVAESLEEAFMRVCPSGQVRSNARIQTAGLLEVGYFDEEGSLCLLLQRATASKARYDVFVTSNLYFALVLATLHPLAQTSESTIEQFDELGGLESTPIDLTDKQQVRSRIRDLELDLRDAALCARLGLLPFSDLSLSDLISPSIITPDF